MKESDMRNTLHPEKEVNIMVLVTDTFGTLVMKAINYGMMLVAMSYNFWVIIVICLACSITSMLIELYSDRKKIS